MENQVYFGDTYLYEESKLGEDRWWESNQPLPIPSVVYCPMPSATTDLGRNIGTGPGLGSISGTGTSTHSGTPGSNFGTSTNYNLNESWSHDSHGQNQSIQSIKPIETSSRSKSLKSKNERPETLISNVYSRRKTSTITLHVPIFDIVIANENGTQAFDTNVALNLPIAIGKGFRIYTHHCISQSVFFQHLSPQF